MFLKLLFLTILQYSTNIKIQWTLYCALYDVLTVYLLNVVVPIAFRDKENVFVFLNSFYQIVFFWKI